MKTKRLANPKFLIAIAALLVLAAATAGAGWYWLRPLAPYSSQVQRHAEALQERILAIDTHLDVPLDYGSDGQQANIDGLTQFDLVKAAKGRLSGAAIAIFAWPDFWIGPNAPHRPNAGFVQAAAAEQEARYRIITGIARDYPNQAGIAYSPDDFRRLAHEGKFAIVISMLNAYPLGEDLNKLDDWAARGMRVFGFSYVGNNAFADSSRPMPFFGDSPDEHGGLSPLGRQAVQRLNALGVVIDVSQMSTLALEQVTQLSKAPVIASHSAVRSLVDLPRNLTDKEMREVAATGGLVSIVGFSSQLKPFSEQTLAKVNQMRADFGLPAVQNLGQASMPADPVFSIWPEQRFGQYARRLYGILDEEPRAGLEEWGDAVEYTVKKIGIDHVAISSDFNDGGGIDGWNDVSETRNVTAELIQRGFSDEDIAKLWGGNFLRVWEQVQRSAGTPLEHHP